MSARVDTFSPVMRMRRELDFGIDGRSWPNRDSSRMVRAGGLRWHVQVMGEGPAMVLLHGAGAATHSWRELMPLLAQRFTVVAPDLPGHGFSERGGDSAMSLPGMASGVGALLEHIGVVPAVMVGHSAGAAIAAQLCLDGACRPGSLVSLNGALLPLAGVAGHLFSPAAQLLSRMPMVSRLFAGAARGEGKVERLIRNTGSTLDQAGIDAYSVVVTSPGHVKSTLTMMAQWDVRALARALPRLRPRLTLIVGERDLTVPPSQARRVCERVPGARMLSLPGLGHLAHEESPQQVSRVIQQAVQQGDSV